MQAPTSRKSPLISTPCGTDLTVEMNGFGPELAPTTIEQLLTERPVGGNTNVGLARAAYAQGE